MTDPRAPERLLAAWLATEAPPRPPAGLRDDIVSATARVRPRPGWLARVKGNHMDVIVGGRARRDPPSNLRLLAVAAAVAMLGVAYLVGGGSDVPRTADSSARPSVVASPAADLASPTAPPTTPASTARPDRTDSVTASGGVLAFPAFDLEYRLPDGFDLERSERGWMAGFALGAPGLSYGTVVDAASGQASLLPGARGVVVADVTFATPRTDNKPRLGTDAASFLDELGSTFQYHVGEAGVVDLNGRPSLRADAWTWAGFSVVETPGEDLALQLARPTRIIVTDVGDAIALIQIWAATPPPYEVVPTGLTPEVVDWIPSAMELIESFRFVEGD